MHFFNFTGTPTISALLIQRYNEKEYNDTICPAAYDDFNYALN